MKICKDGRVWGQTNREAGGHLGILTGRKYEKRGTASASKEGRNNPMYGKIGGESPRFGKRHTSEARAIMSEQKLGEKHPNWKGGITGKRKVIMSRIEYRLWREAIFARDNWTCQRCGKRGDLLNAHHKKPYSQFSEFRLAMDNGTTLCLKCHRIVESERREDSKNVRS